MTKSIMEANEKDCWNTKGEVKDAAWELSGRLLRRDYNWVESSKMKRNSPMERVITNIVTKIT